MTEAATKLDYHAIYRQIIQMLKVVNWKISMPAVPLRHIQSHVHHTCFTEKRKDNRLCRLTNSPKYPNLFLVLAKGEIDFHKLHLESLSTTGGP